MSKLSYAIIGTGAIGGYFGGRLQQAGSEVHFLLRSDYEQVQTNGLRIDSVNGDFVLPQVSAYNSAAEMPAVDVVIVALKTTHNTRLLDLLPPIKPGGAILSLQNGLNVESAIAQQLIKHSTHIDHIFGGLCFICANKAGPGYIQHQDYGWLTLGSHTANGERCPSSSPLLETIAADFRRGKVPVELTDDLPMTRWRKLVWNVPYNSLSVVLDATTQEMMADSRVRSLITTLMTEVVSTANAWGEATSPGIGRQLSQDIIHNMLAHTEKMTPYRTSMKLDYDERRPLELEAILGEPIRTANALDLAVPCMEMLYQQLTFIDQANTNGGKPS